MTKYISASVEQTKPRGTFAGMMLVGVIGETSSSIPARKRAALSSALQKKTTMTSATMISAGVIETFPIRPNLNIKSCL